MSISIKNLTIRREGRVILDNIDWVIEENSYTLLLGGNGSGKTTLVRTMLGLIQQSSGTIQYKDQPLQRELISSKFGYIPQYSTIKKNFPITVEEVIKLECNSSPNKCNIEPIQHLKPLGIDKLLGKNISDLSGGELQKVLIARGLVTEPEVLILDEPNNNLDSQSEAFILKFLKNYHSKGNKIIIHITHDRHEVPEIEGIQEVVIRDGKLLI